MHKAIMFLRTACTPDTQDPHTNQGASALNTVWRIAQLGGLGDAALPKLPASKQHSDIRTFLHSHIWNPSRVPRLRPDPRRGFPTFAALA